MPRQRTPRGLNEFLILHFSEHELIQFLEGLPNGAEIVDSISRVNMTVTSGEATSALRRRGLLDRDFWKKLESERPNFCTEIDALEAAEKAYSVASREQFDATQLADSALPFMQNIREWRQPFVVWASGGQASWTVRIAVLFCIAGIAAVGILIRPLFSRPSRPDVCPYSDSDRAAVEEEIARCLDSLERLPLLIKAADPVDPALVSLVEQHESTCKAPLMRLDR